MSDAKTVTSAHALTKRGIAFVGVFFVSQFGWQYLHGTSIESGVIHYATVKPAAELINLLTPELHVQADRFSLKADGESMNILNGCEGMDALLLLVSAFIAAPLSWSVRVWGVLVGTTIVFVANQTRIVVLFYVSRFDYGLFEQIHAVLAPIAVILVVSLYFYACLLRANRRATSTV